MLSETQIALVQKSFTRAVPRAEVLMIRFYERLFELAPETRSLFPEDMQAQRANVVSTLATVVRSLANLEPLLADIRALGMRHTGYGVKDEHYAIVGEALVWSLEETLRPAWNDATADAWAEAYRILADVMIEAAHGRSNDGRN
ncbi:globin family protein [Algicella marina]|uniref:Hemin receptor n=1 Tax=Algicella marina TaxID=2683284 RepID=A0A6P1T3D4_9RHOB|nr:globin family protein [Algicella marina]QHQ36245.1 hemin receptor [Algicella marina]